MPSPVSVPVADRITCAVVGPPGEWKGRVRFPRWSSIDDVGGPMSPPHIVKARRTSLEDQQRRARSEQGASDGREDDN
ncbi:unnamed protein product [Caenorhabditis nigoni]